MQMITPLRLMVMNPLYGVRILLDINILYEDRQFQFAWKHFRRSIVSTINFVHEVLYYRVFLIWIFNLHVLND